MVKAYIGLISHDPRTIASIDLTPSLTSQRLTLQDRTIIEILDYSKISLIVQVIVEVNQYLSVSRDQLST